MVLEKTKNQPFECVFIDDQERLLEPARKLGMHTLHFQNPRQLEEALIKLGINV